MSINCLRHNSARLAATILATLVGLPVVVSAQQFGSPSIVHKVEQSGDRLEMQVNTSRILTLEEKIPRAQVANQDLLDLTPVSAKQVQVYAKKPGVTQVNLWDERNEIHSIDVIIYGDVRQLAMQLQAQFPTSSIKVTPTANSVILSGYVDRADQVEKIVRIAEDYYPKVINNITVGGSQQILLHVKVMEVSRTKLRDLGVDFADIGQSGSFVISSISGLLRSATASTVSTNAGATLTAGIVDGNNSFFAVISALQKNSLMKILAEPTLVTVSGRPAYFTVGGEIPVLIPQSLGTVTIDWRRFGTQVDFVPIVLGNGNIRLEVRPRVSEIDTSISVTLNGSTIPGFRTREVDTGVEMKVGQTLALAGLIQNRVESEKTGIPWVSDLPYVGVPFRRVKNNENEIETLILVRPELADALDPDEVPPCGPGLSTTSPNNWDLYMRGYIEVPKGGHGGPGVGPMGPAHPEGIGPGKPVPSAEPIPSGPAVGEPGPTAKRNSRRAVTEQIPLPSAIATDRVGGGGEMRASERSNRQIPTIARPSQVRPASRSESRQPGFIGPTGYDVK